jgi:hypothetical protein
MKTPNDKKGATPTVHQTARQFVMAFAISLVAMMAAAVLYVLFGNNFVFDARAQLLVVTLVLIGVIVGLAMIRAGEKHAGYGVLFGSLFGLLIGILGMAFIGLLLVAYPATGLSNGLFN